MRHLMMTLRSLVRQPAVTVPAVLTLALGIGANTALFAYLSALVWPRLETRDAQRVVFVYSGTAEATRQQTQFSDYAVMAREQKALGELTAYSSFGSSVGLPEQTTFASRPHRRPLREKPPHQSAVRSRGHRSPDLRDRARGPGRGGARCLRPAGTASRGPRSVRGTTESVDCQSAAKGLPAR